jgi:hypothetical protein
MSEEAFFGIANSFDGPDLRKAVKECLFAMMAVGSYFELKTSFSTMRCRNNEVPYTYSIIFVFFGRILTVQCFKVCLPPAALIFRCF